MSKRIVFIENGKLESMFHEKPLYATRDPRYFKVIDAANKILSDQQLYIFMKVAKEGKKVSEVVRIYNSEKSLTRSKQIKRSTFYNQYYRAISKLKKYFIDETRNNK